MVPSYDELDQLRECQVTALDSAVVAIGAPLVVQMSAQTPNAPNHEYFDLFVSSGSAEFAVGTPSSLLLSNHERARIIGADY